MFILSILIAAIIVGMGISKNMRHGEAIAQEYSFLLTSLAGLGGAIALIGFILTSAGLHCVQVIIIGLIILILCLLPALKQAKEDVAFAKENNLSPSEYKYIKPLPVFIRLALVGIGKMGHLLIIITVVGIPAYNSMKESQKALDEYTKQTNLRNKAEAMEEAKEIVEAMQENQKKLDHIKAMQETEKKISEISNK